MSSISLLMSYFYESYYLELQHGFQKKSRGDFELQA